MTTTKTLTYVDAGVDVALGEQFVARIKQLAPRAGHAKLKKAAGGYAAVYELAADKLIALTTDGVGTKVLLAEQLNQHHGIGIDLVAMCANDLICVGARPTLFLDYFATGKLQLDVATQLIEGILDGCDQCDMLLVGGETAEMPDVYGTSQYDLAGFAVGELSLEALLTGDAVQPGQKIIGLASSGIHSNGLSLARKLLTSESDLTELLTPTQLYVKPINALQKQFGVDITGMVHVTGGGWRNLFRLNSAVGFEIQKPLPYLPVCQKLLASGITLEEGLKTFNMGMGFALLVRDNADAIVAELTTHGITAQIVGEVTDAAGHLTLIPEQLTIYPKT